MTDLLKRASIEIKSLRQQNQIMAARLQVYDEMMQMFRASPPNQTMGYSPDITYEIDKAIAEESETKNN